MGLILLEALLALCIFILIVWWTMFSGRKKGELPPVTSALEQDRVETRSTVPSTPDQSTRTDPADTKIP
jgi:hypothetical protein